MGKRAPEDVNVMTTALGPAAPVDPVPASPAIPQTIDTIQHSLVTKGKHVGGMTVGVYIPDNTTATVFVPVPPSVVYMRVTCLVAGAGDVSIDSTNNGTAKTFSATGTDDGVIATKTFATTNVPGDLFDSPLKVRSSAAWTWTSEAVTVTFTTTSVITGADGFIFGISFDPIWQPQDV